MLRQTTVCLLLVLTSKTLTQTRPASGQHPKLGITLSQQQASSFARLALDGIQKEYPNKPEHVLNSEADIRSPRALHPAFYGSFDWHSSVHSHWMLVRLLRMFPDLPESAEIRGVLAKHLTAENLQAEANYFTPPNRSSFERTYGWSWLLKLAEEIHRWDDPEARQWSQNSAMRHIDASLPPVTSGEYSGEHWLASFAVYLLSLP